MEQNKSFPIQEKFFSLILIQMKNNGNFSGKVNKSDMRSREM
jgi:hypothetical protein